MLIYRLAISLFALGAVPVAWRRGGAALVSARLALGPGAKGPHIWWHGASNGELTSSRALLERLLAERPDLQVLVTCNSATGEALVQSWRLDRVTTRPAPLDLGWAVRRLMRRWNVTAHVTLESEIWPNRVLLCPGPVIVLGARMTASNARVWGRFPRLAKRLLNAVALVSPQDKRSGERLLGLGLPEERLGPVCDLKAGFIATAKTPDTALARAFDRAQTWLAASTHPGEDEIVLEAHRQARIAEPSLRLILVPRHPRRAGDIVALTQAAGLSVARRSLGEAPDADVYLADTMGEMDQWYALSGRVFIGGSLGDLGGHTPYEPAAFGCALLHGPDMTKQAKAVPRLRAADASAQISNAHELAQALSDLRATQAEAGQRARRALSGGADAETLGDRLLTILQNGYDA